MRKRLLTLLTLVLGVCSGAWAQTTIGLTQTVTDDGDTHTVGSATYTGATNVTVAKSIGSSCNDGQTGKTVKVGSPEVSYSATEAFRKTVKGTDFVDAQYVGYTMTVASGYKVSLSNLNAEFWSSDATMYWKVVVANASGTALYTSSTVQNNSNNKGTITVASPTGVSDLTAGTYTIKLMMYQYGGNKYFVVPSLTFSATVEEDDTPTYTITSSAGAGGTVSPDGATSVIENGNLSITATANTGYAFASWTVDGVENASTANPYTFSSVTAAHTIAAVFNAMHSVSFNVPSENKGTSTVGPATQYANIENKWTAPQNYYTAKEGYTLTAWNDGVNNYVPGTEYTLDGNITIAPVYTANTVTVADFTTETTVSWPLSTNGGAPALASEGNTQYYVQQATIAGNTVDIPIFVNTVQDYGISGKKGKFVSSATNCQVNAGTVFKIPAAKNMVVNYIFSSTTAVGNVGFTDNTSNLGGDGTALTAPSGISGDNKTITYTYTGTADYLYMVDKAGSKYPTGITVTYPEKQTKYASPTITVGDFNFTSHAYPVTITASEGDLYVSTDGTSYTAQTSPYEVNVTSTTHFYAKATGASYDDSDVADENVTYSFDGAKSYVAWIYESDYANAPKNYAIGSDAIHTAMAAVYNVVDVDIKDYKSAITDAQKTALNGNLDDADLVVISEAATGSSKGIIALKDLVGTVPMLSMKLFSYTYNADASKNRWGWGSPANADKAVVSITPASTLYKVLDGVTITDDAITLFDYPNDQNHIQYVSSWQTEPAGDVVLATTSSKPAIHASTSQKYLGFGISCDDFTKYNTNAITIVKNAAAMLIAGEDLDAKITVPATITSAGWATLYTDKALDFSGVSGLTAYTATCSGSTVTLTPVSDVPANTGVVLKGSANTYNIPTTESSSTDKGHLLGSASAATAWDAYTGYTLYVLTQASDGVNVEFNPVTSGEIAAGKAFLKVSSGDSSLAPTLNVVFAGGTTGIDSAVKSDELRDKSYYNLAGQRVAQPTKGLYIVGGKKVVVK